MTIPFNCRLSDFSEDQLEQMIALILKEQGELSSKIAAFKEYGNDVELMFWTEIQLLHSQINELAEMFVQFSGALRYKQRERIISSN